MHKLIKNNIKIQYLLDNWPIGQVATSAWLNEMGISRQLTWRYQQSGWLEALGVGAYKRPKESIEWQGGVAGLQQQLALEVHVGDPTAFSVRGTSHYVRFGKENIFLFSPPNEKLPKWFTDFDWNNPIHHVRTSIFPKELGVGTYKHHGVQLKVSAPERAILECLHTSPKSLTCWNVISYWKGSSH